MGDMKVCSVIHDLLRKKVIYDDNCVIINLFYRSVLIDSTLQLCMKVLLLLCTYMTVF